MKRRPNSDTLASLGENELVRRLARHLPLDAATLVGAGDDCAVIRPPGGKWLTLFKTDSVVEHVHFLPNTPPQQVGWKALGRCLSDMAAMGGLPSQAVVTLAAPKDTPWRWVKGVYAGLDRIARRFASAIVGGETTALPDGSPRLLSIALLGKVEPRHLLRRDTARAGDLLFVTGKLGGSLSGWHLRFVPRIEEARWLAENFRPSAAMDLSDGLGQDLPRLAAASGVGFSLDLAALPVRRGCTVTQALGDGEDFELLFALPPKKAAALTAAWKKRFPSLPLTCIGKLTPQSHGQPLPQLGWQHFMSPPPPKSRDAAATKNV